MGAAIPTWCLDLPYFVRPGGIAVPPPVREALHHPVKYVSDASIHTPECAMFSTDMEPPKHRWR